MLSGFHSAPSRYPGRKMAFRRSREMSDGTPEMQPSMIVYRARIHQPGTMGARSSAGWTASNVRIDYRFAPVGAQA